MSIFNYKSKEIIVKIVYYGPGVGGKTTSIQRLHEKTIPERKGELYFLATEADQTIYFELLPLYAGEIGNFKLRFQVYTVPGQVKYNNTRKAVLQGADAIVFVADSQRGRRQANMVSLKNLEYNLKGGYNVVLEDLPLVYEYNKRDLKDVLTIDELNQDLNSRNIPFFETIAIDGTGVLEAFELISSLAITAIEKKMDGQLEEKPRGAPQQAQKKSAQSPPPFRPASHDTGKFFIGDDDRIGAVETAASNQLLDDVIGEADISAVPENEKGKGVASPELVMKTCQDGEIIFEEGQHGDEMYFIEGGKVKIVGTYKNEEKVLVTYKKRDFFGELVILSGQLRSVKAIAVGETCLIPVDKDMLAAQISGKPEIAAVMLETLSGRIRSHTQTINKLAGQKHELMKRLKKAQITMEQLVKQNKLLRHKLQSLRK